MSLRNTPVRDDTSRVVRSRPGCGPPYDARALVVGRIRCLLTQKGEFLFFVCLFGSPPSTLVEKEKTTVGQTVITFSMADKA